jgi:hypothetical protein
MTHIGSRHERTLSRARAVSHTAGPDTLSGRPDHGLGLALPLAGPLSAVPPALGSPYPRRHPLVP